MSDSEKNFIWFYVTYLLKLTSTPISELKLPNIYRILLYSGCWICGVWCFYHLFSYTRQYFEGLTIFDIVFIALMVPIGLIFAIVNRTRPMLNIIIGFFGLAICGYFGIFNTPFSYQPAEAPIQTFFFGLIQTEKGAINFGFILMCSIIITSGMLQFWYWEKLTRRNTMHEKLEWSLNMALAMIISLGVYIGIVFSFRNSFQSAFYCLAFVSSAFLFIIGLIPGKIPNVYFSEDDRILINLVQDKPTLSTSTKIVQSLAIFLTWATSSAYILLTTFIYHKFIAESNRVIDVLQLFESLLIGAAFILIMNINETVKKIYRILVLMVMPISLWRLATQGINGTLDPFSFEAGIAITSALWLYMERVGTYSKSKLGGVWITLTLVVAAYLAFIPAHLEEITNVANQVAVYLTVIVAIDLISLYLFAKVPSVHDLRAYIINVPQNLQKKGNKLAAGIIEKLREEYKYEP